jgi:YHYH protein
MKSFYFLTSLLPLTVLLASCGGGGGSSSSLTVPGTPTIGVATAGDASAIIAFTAPASNGGSAITSYTATCTAAAVSKSAVGTSSPIAVSGLTNSTAYSCAVTANNATGTGTASAAVALTPVASAGGNSSSTVGVKCDYLYSQFNANALVNMTSTSRWSCSGSVRTLTANGIPDHDVGPFSGPITPAVAAQTVSFTVTTSPTAGATSNIGQQASGYALNGIPFDPSTNGFCPDSATSANLTTGGCNQNGRVGTWQMEAIGQSLFDFGADSSNAHVRPGAGLYHYHGMPNGLLRRLGLGTAMSLIGWANDGYPIYARYGHAAAMDANSAIKVMVPSWTLKGVPDAGRPAVSVFPMGTFTQDFEYVAGKGDLDECNGRSGVTPEFPVGTYHYLVTDAFPFTGRCIKGSLDR